MSTPKPLKLPAILFAAAQIFCACSKETPPPIYDAPLFESQADFKEKRTLDFVCAKNFSAVGAAVGFSETKNVARLFFTDLQRAFTEVDFFADGKKRKIVSRESADANSARFSLENGGTLSLKKLENGMMKFRAKASKTSGKSRSAPTRAKTRSLFPTQRAERRAGSRSGKILQLLRSRQRAGWSLISISARKKSSRPRRPKGSRARKSGT